MSNYNVVLQYTRSAGAYAGVITWRSFESKVKFDDWIKSTGLNNQKVVTEGVSVDEAITLCRKTPLASHMAAAAAASINRHTGKVDEYILSLQLLDIALIT